MCSFEMNPVIDISPRAGKNQAAEFGWPGGDQPGEVAFPHPVEPRVREAIVGALQSHLPISDDANLTALTPPADAVGRFKLAGRNGTWFVRVSARWGDPQLEQAITGFLRERGVAVNHLECAGLTLEFDSQRLRLDVRELVPGRHFDQSPTDLRAVASALSECHRAMRDFPESEKVRAASSIRFENFERARDEMSGALKREDWYHFADDESWARDHAEWLRELTEKFDPRFDLRPGAQCLHAQVHRGNVLFRTSDAQPVFVDFEEAVHTFAPPAWDLGYFVQRFCLFDNPAPEIATERIGAVRESYGALDSGVVEMMRQTAWLSIAVIVSNRQAGLANPATEYEKFVRLDRQAVAIAPLFAGSTKCSNSPAS